MKNKILLSTFSVAIFMVLTSGVNDNNGKAGRTGSPGEQTCVNGCHNSYALNSGTATIGITSNIPNWEYTPGQTYTINVTATQSGFNLYGIGFEALNSSNTNGGTLTPGSDTQIKSSGGRTNIVHKLNSGTGTSHTFTFTWTAPAQGTGNVTFYWANVSASQGNSNQLDYVYTRSQVVTEYVAPSLVSEVEKEVSAIQIFPNPVQREFTLNYFLKHTGFVGVDLFGLNGQLIQSLSGKVLTAGQQTEHLSLPENLLQGIYLIRVNNNGKSTTCKLTVL